MAKKLGNGGYGQENYDPKTGEYVKGNEDANPNNDGINKKNVSSINNFYEEMGFSDDDFEDVDLDDMPYDEKFDNIIVDDDEQTELENPLDKLYNKKKKETTHEENCKACNPNFHLGKKWQYNCQRCVVAYDMQCRGYDVEALPYNSNDLQGCFINYSKTWKGLSEKDGILVKKQGVGHEGAHKGIQNVLSQYPVGARFLIRLRWSVCSGHVLIGEMTEHGPQIIDPQSGDYYKPDDASYCFNCKPTKVKMYRIDDKEIDEKYISVSCKNRGENK